MTNNFCHTFFFLFNFCSSHVDVSRFWRKLEQKRRRERVTPIKYFRRLNQTGRFGTNISSERFSWLDHFHVAGEKRIWAKHSGKRLNFHSMSLPLSLSLIHTHTRAQIYTYALFLYFKILSCFHTVFPCFPLSLSFHSLALSRAIYYIYIFVHVLFRSFFFFLSLFTNVLACVSVQFSFRVCLSVYMYIFLRLNNVRYHLHALSLSPIISRFT